MEIILFYIPVSNIHEAESLGKLAVTRKLAACANTFPVQSTYAWQGDIQHDEEVVLLLKTAASKEVDLRALIEENHSYEVPAILSWKAEVNKPYGLWVEESLI